LDTPPASRDSGGAGILSLEEKVQRRGNELYFLVVQKERLHNFNWNVVRIVGKGVALTLEHFLECK